ncbi:zinc-binding dehydrogenase [Rhodovulum sulfidophilum]|uniref:zinc-binding dehydrogenase n=1 Tax=Rhodovulum sulfidophilum TaxID=35806 RepID=UPI001928C92C|nr:zinc-binding dehydrogenase [Rhodovulum sulfidophilum]MBL3584737.1 zinc-binding dehydrogenase [Rhodovulum sulfidophilum]
MTAALSWRGFQRRPVMLVYPAGIEFGVSFLAAMAAGCIAAPWASGDWTTRKRSLPRLLHIAGDCTPAAAIGPAKTLGGLDFEQAVPHVLAHEDLRAEAVGDFSLANERGIARLRGRIRAAAGDPSIDIVFEHPGAETFWASVALLRHGGRVVTCGSTSGHEHRYDNRRLWMHVKSIIGSHGANYHEAWQANRLVCRGLIHPVLTDTGQLADGVGLVRRLRDNLHIGKIAMLCQAAAPRDGIRDPDLRRAAGVDPFLQKLMVS